MTTGQGTTSASTGEAVILTRVFDAPRDLVFKAWTDPEHLKQWWAPAGFTTPHCTVDLRVGGMFHYCFRSPEGQDFWGRGIYREIVPSERIVYVDSFSDAHGNLVEPARYGISPAHPTESVVTVTFVEQDGKTKVTVHHAVPATVPERSDMALGWSQMFDRLAAMLATA